MTAAFNEMPLALFTTLAAIGAGAFITLACAFFTAKLSDEQLKRVDKMTLIPAVVVIVGFIAAFFHLTSPAHAMNVFNGLGRSPMSNELLVAVLFAVVMIVYVIIGAAGKLSEGSRKGFAAVVAVLGIVFAVFMGLAYGIATVPTWNSPWPVVQVLGFALLGGAALGALVLALSGALSDALQSSFKTNLVVIAGIGCVLGVAGLAFMAGAASGVANALVSGSVLLGDAMVCLVVAIVCLILAFVAVFMSTRAASVTAWAGVATVCALAGVLAGRFVFYALHISVGLYF